MYNNATVIRLSPSTPVVSSRGVSRVSSVRSATFEEAFGEYSELRGKRRQKRQDRRMDKIEARRERRKAREEARREKKLGRIQTRDEAKSGRRLNRQRRRTDVMEARQDRRTGRMEKVQDRRTGRKKKRLERRELGREEDERDDLGTGTSTSEPIDRPSGAPSDSQGGSAPSDSQGGGGYADEQGGGGYADEQGGGGYADEQGGGGYADEQGGGGYADEQGGGGYADEQGGGYADEQGGGYADEQGGGGDDSGEYSEEQEMGDYGAEEEGYDYSEPFDGIPVDASFSEMDDSGKASKKVTVNPKLQDLVNKIEWNKELVSRLEDKRKKGVANPSDTSKSIIERKKRIAELESQLEMYLGFDSYSMANGMSERDMRNEVARRRMEVNSARQRARAIRMGSKNERSMADMTNRRLRAKMGRNHGGDVTPVDVDLKPEITSNRIIVPAEKSSMATGIIGLDDAGDFDSRELDIKLSADGDMPMRQPFSMAEGDFYYGGNGETTKSTGGRSINWTGVVLGIGVGALAIWAIRKYKIIK
jgi:hypothetical protein